MLRPLYPLGKSCRYPLNRRLPGSQTLCGPGDEKSLDPNKSKSRDSSIGTATGYGLDETGAGNFFDTMSRPALGPTQPPIQWVPGVLSMGVKRPGRGADHSPPSSAEVRMNGAIPPLPNTSSWRSA
jgi:hypothetical protein